MVNEVRPSRPNRRTPVYSSTVAALKQPLPSINHTVAVERLAYMLEIGLNYFSTDVVNKFLWEKFNQLHQTLASLQSKQLPGSFDPRLVIFDHPEALMALETIEHNLEIYLKIKEDGFTVCSANAVLIHSLDFFLSRVEQLNASFAPAISAPPNPILIKSPAQIQAERITANLKTLGQEDNIVNVLAALKLLRTLRINNNFESRLINGARHEVIGAIGELLAILEINKSADILYVNLILKRDDGKEIELDIVARSRRNGQLLIIEAKYDATYTMGDLAHQLFGVGNNNKLATKKDICQLDLFLKPERFTNLPPQIKANLLSEDYEVRIIFVCNPLADFSDHLGKLRSFDYLLRKIQSLAEEGILSFSKDIITDSPTQLLVVINNQLAAIRRIRPGLEGIGVRFNRLKIY